MTATETQKKPNKRLLLAAGLLAALALAGGALLWLRPWQSAPAAEPPVSARVCDGALELRRGGALQTVSDLDALAAADPFFGLSGAAAELSASGGGSALPSRGAGQIVIYRPPTGSSGGASGGSSGGSSSGGGSTPPPPPASGDGEDITLSARSGIALRLLEAEPAPAAGVRLTDGVVETRGASGWQQRGALAALRAADPFLGLSGAAAELSVSGGGTPAVSRGAGRVAVYRPPTASPGGSSGGSAGGGSSSGGSTPPPAPGGEEWSGDYL